MKRKMVFSSFVLLIFSISMSPGISWAEDTRSRIYQLESRVEALENQASYLGVHWISSLNFVAPWWIETERIYPSYLGMLTDYTGDWPVKMFAPVLIPHKCTITEIQFRARDQSDTGDIFVGIYDQSEDPITEEDIPIAYKDTSEWTSTETYNTFSTGAISLPYDPTNFVYNNEWYVAVEFNDNVDFQRLRWVKIYYSIP